jgi:group I intron endonuclease
MKAKYKVGIENWDQLAICKATGEEVIYNPSNPIGLKRHLTKIGVKSDNLLDHFNLIDNPYKNLERIYCKVCNKSFKDVKNTSGQLTSHIQRSHQIAIPDYVKQHPDQEHLFQATLKILSKEDPTLTNEDSRIQCPICSKYFKAIKAPHAKMHGMTLDEFREHTGLQDLQSKSSKERAKEIYYGENGLVNYKKPSKPKPEKIKKNKSRKSIKQYVSGVDYPTYNTDEILAEGKHFIYKLTSPSGKCYIGRTNHFFKRMASHYHKSGNIKNNNWLYQAVRKYGWDNFTKEIIDIPDNLEHAKERELYWIKFFNSFHEGYNGIESSEGGVSWEGRKHTQEYKNFIEKVRINSKNRIPKKASEETRAKMSKASKGRHTLEWFQNKYGEEEGTKLYQERSEKLSARKDQVRDENGRFIKKEL